MASVQPRGKSFSVVYTHEGKQIWESFKTKKEADKRKLQIDYEQVKGTFLPPSPMTLEKFLEDYVELYGTTNWDHSSYSNNVSLMNNYINPIIGQLKLKEINAKRMDKYFTQLKSMEAIQQTGRLLNPGLISNRNIHDINLLLHNAFNRAVEWGDISINPVTKNACPKRETAERIIWEPEVAKRALSICKNLTLLACMHLSIACSMRIGEITGITWPLLSFGDVNNNFADAVLKIDAQLQRISMKSYEKLKGKKNHIKFIFPACRENNKTMLVLKNLKTNSSRREVWIPRTTAAILWKVKKEQDEIKAILGDEYQDFGLIIAQKNGRPYEGKIIDDMFLSFISENELPVVEFHSLRHLSTTVKLQISKGDIKSVQGDTGHAQAKMVTDTYAHILDKSRKKTAKLFEQAFYAGQDETTEDSNDFIEKLLTACLTKPEVVMRLKNVLSSD
ncbi:MAG: tyrosine-type recombinase/integrase [Clostridiales bacterium]|jgi:integrase|nr:tyrosine-type recombinase/integrase [Clostridiales bacterium]